MFNLIKKLYSKPNVVDIDAEKFYINIPYSEKDQAKKLRAKWDPAKKSWFIPKGSNKDCFEKWLPKGQKEDADINTRSQGLISSGLKLMLLVLLGEN